VSRHIEDLKRDATPGTPYSLLGGDNGRLVDTHRALLIELTIRRLSRLRSSSPQTTSIEAVESDLCDPVRVFIKNEPHKLEKIRTRRLRLIWVLSVIDQLVERVLYADQTKCEISNWKTSPTKPGMGATDEDFSSLYDYMLQLNAPAHAPPGLSNTDVKGWDLTVKRWMQVADFATRMLHWNVDLESDLARVSYNVMELRCQPVISLSNGKLFVKLLPGNQISGRLITSNGNSRMRVVLASLRYAPCMAMGDDCVESSLGEAAAPFYESLGFTVEETLHSDPAGITFCSHQYTEDKVAFLSTAGRTLFRFFSRKSRMVDYMQLEDAIRHYPEPARSTALAQCLEFAMANERAAIMAEEGRHVPSHEGGGESRRQAGEAKASTATVEPGSGGGNA